MIVAALLAVAAAQASSATADSVKPSGLSDAAAFCQWRIGTREGSFQMPSGSIAYQNLPPEAVAAMKRTGMPSIPTVQDMPELVLRFAQTQPTRHSANMDAVWFEYASYSRAGSKAWTVAYPKLPACDVMVTGSARFIEERDALLTSMQNAGWTMEGAAPDAAAPFWQTVLVNGPDRATFRGLPQAAADSDGVQMEIQFVRSDAR